MNVSIRFCSMCGYEPQVLAVTGPLLTTFKRKLAALTLIPDSGGCFEVTVNDELIYSKLATEEFPDTAQLVEEVRKRLGA